MNIVRLTSENVLRLNAVSITPEGNIIIIGGKNGQGKTSVLDSIMMALAGKDSKKHPKPLKEDAKKGFTEVQLSNGWTVKRTYTKAGGGTLMIKSEDGGTFKQANLNELFSGLTFDGLEWLNIDASKQVQILQTLVGLDFTEIEKERKQFYDDRTIVNREIMKQESVLEGLNFYKEVPQKYISVSELSIQLQEIIKKNAENEKARENFKDKLKELSDLNQREADLQTELSKIRGELKVIKSQVEADQKVINSLVDGSADDIQNQITDAESINEKIKENAEYQKALDILKEKKKESESLTGKISDLDDKKESQMSAAQFPIEGLSFDESGVLYNGIPFRQASSAEKLRVSVAMGIALNPELKVLLIRDGSLLDEDNLKMVAEMADKSGHQVWIERVSTDRNECQVIIEDGMVAIEGEIEEISEDDLEGELMNI